MKGTSKWCVIDSTTRRFCKPDNVNYIGELRLSDAGKEVRLAGWVNSIRKLGGLNFVTLRDHFGMTQLLVKDESLLNGVNKECTITVEGKVLEIRNQNNFIQQLF